MRTGGYRWAATRKFGGIAAVFVAAVFTVTAVVVFHRLRRADRRAEALDSQVQHAVERLREGTWQRPVLRGLPRDCNALSPSLHLAAPWKNRPQLDRILAGKMAPTSELRALVRANQQQLDELLAATQCSHSWYFEVPDIDAVPALPALSHHQAWTELLLVRAILEPPDTCLQTTVDVIRRTQDLVPGGGSARLGSSYLQVNAAIGTTLRCAELSHRAARDCAARELLVLAEHPPPVGAALETECLWWARLASSGQRIQRRSAPWYDLERWRLDKSDSIEAELALLPRLAPLRAAMYPTDLDRGVALLQGSSGGCALAADVLTRDAAAQAGIRVTALALAILNEAEDQGHLPQHVGPIADAPFLRDPFDGARLHWQVAANASRGVVWSVGPNGRDDGGAADDLSALVELPHPSTSK